MTVERFLFRDSVAGKPVFLCVDKFGRKWMATGAWALFRCRCPPFPTKEQ